MRAAVLLALASSGLSLLSEGLAAQNAPSPRISSIPARKSYAPGNVAILGSNMGLVGAVRVNGESFPILRVTAGRIVVGPVSPQDPGFGSVELIHGAGIEPGTIELLPTLAVDRRGRRLDIRLNNGDTGLYTLRYSFQRLGEPVIDSGLYGPRWLAPDATILAAGVFADAGPVLLQARMPMEIGQIGNPLILQALCTADSESVEVYTNFVQVRGFGNPHF